MSSKRYVRGPLSVLPITTSNASSVFVGVPREAMVEPPSVTGMDVSRVVSWNPGREGGGISGAGARTPFTDQVYTHRNLIKAIVERSPGAYEDPHNSSHEHQRKTNLRHLVEGSAA